MARPTTTARPTPKTLPTVESEIVKATGVKRKGADDQKYYTELMHAACADDVPWEDFSEKAQEWITNAVQAHDDGEPIKSFVAGRLPPEPPKKGKEKEATPTDDDLDALFEEDATDKTAPAAKKSKAKTKDEDTDNRDETPDDAPPADENEELIDDADRVRELICRKPSWKLSLVLKGAKEQKLKVSVADIETIYVETKATLDVLKRMGKIDLD